MTNNLSQRESIQKFHRSFIISRDFLISQLSPHDSPNIVWQQNVEHYILLIASLWYLQRKAVFEGDHSYFLNQFNLIKTTSKEKGETRTDFCFWFHGLIAYLFGQESANKNQYSSLPRFGSHILRENHGIRWTTIHDINFDDRLLYDPTISFSEKDISGGLPVLNLLLFQEETANQIDEFTIGALFEKILTDETKKSTGAYYTPKNICDFIAEEALSPLLFPNQHPFWDDNWVQRLETYKKSLIDFLKKAEKEEFLTRFHRFHGLRILDPAVGSGHFLASMIDKIIDVYRIFWSIAREMPNDSLVQFRLETIERAFEIDFKAFRDFKSIELILRAYHIIPNMLHALDINPFSVLISKIRILLNSFTQYQKNLSITPNSDLFFEPNIKTGNSLYGFNWKKEFPRVFALGSGVSDEKRGLYDLIIGNPPYGNLLTAAEKQKVSDYAHFPNEISAVFIDCFLGQLAIEGNLVFITSYAICFSKDLSATRRGIAENFRYCKIATFDRDKCRFFEGMTQSVSVLQCISKMSKDSPEKQSAANFYTTNMYRSMPSLSKLSYQDANQFLLLDNSADILGEDFNCPHRLPKIGYQELTTLLDQVKSHFKAESKEINQSNVGSLIGSFKIIKNAAAEITFQKQLQGQDYIFLRISGNYWYNALDRAPYYGTQIAIVPLIKTENFERELLLCLINSSLFYVWFRIYSDGRHLNSDILRSFPLPQRYPENLAKYGPFLRKYCRVLLDTLFDHFDPYHNRFLSSEIKAMIDAGDRLLGDIYGFPQEIIDFCINFESEIRGGRALTPKENELVIQSLGQLRQRPTQEKLASFLPEFEKILLDIKKRLKK